MYFPSFRGHRYFQNEILGFPLLLPSPSSSSFPLLPPPPLLPSLPPPTHSAWGNLLGVMVQDALRHAMESGVAFRRGLPCNILGLPGEFRDNADVATSLGGVTSLVKAHAGELIGRHAESLQVTTSVQTYFKDFKASRLPPHDYCRDSTMQGSWVFSHTHTHTHTHFAIVHTFSIEHTHSLNTHSLYTHVHFHSAPAHTLHFSCRCCMLITRVHYFFNPLKSSHTLIGQY